MTSDDHLAHSDAIVSVVALLSMICDSDSSDSADQASAPVPVRLESSDSVSASMTCADTSQSLDQSVNDHSQRVVPIDSVDVEWLPLVHKQHIVDCLAVLVARLDTLDDQSTVNNAVAVNAVAPAAVVGLNLYSFVVASFPASFLVVQKIAFSVHLVVNTPTCVVDKRPVSVSVADVALVVNFADDRRPCQELDMVLFVNLLVHPNHPNRLYYQCRRHVDLALHTFHPLMIGMPDIVVAAVFVVAMDAAHDVEHKHRAEAFSVALLMHRNDSIHLCAKVKNKIN